MIILRRALVDAQKLRDPVFSGSVVCKPVFAPMLTANPEKMPKVTRRSLSDSSDHEAYSPETVDVLDADAGEAVSGVGARAPELKPDVSYIEMIARVILSSREKKLCLQDIYVGIEKMYPYFRSAPPRWRNSVRHNLSLHECFCKGERCENGKGHYWCIHPANVDDFARGDFRRRLIKSRVRQMQQCHALYMQYQLAFPSARDLYRCHISPITLQALNQPSVHFIRAVPSYTRATLPYIQPLVCYNSQAVASVTNSTIHSAASSPKQPSGGKASEKTCQSQSNSNTIRKSNLIFSVENILS